VPEINDGLTPAEGAETLREEGKGEKRDSSPLLSRPERYFRKTLLTRGNLDKRGAVKKKNSLGSGD